MSMPAASIIRCNGSILYFISFIALRFFHSLNDGNQYGYISVGDLRAVVGTSDVLKAVALPHLLQGFSRSPILAVGSSSLGFSHYKSLFRIKASIILLCS